MACENCFCFIPCILFHTKVIRTHRDWVWSRAWPMKGDCTLRGFEHVGKATFCGKVKHRKKEHETTGAKDEAEANALDNKVDGSDALADRKGGGSVGTWKLSWIQSTWQRVIEFATESEADILRDDDDPPFIVLTETKFRIRCIPVWDRYSPHRTRVEKKKSVPANVTCAIGESYFSDKGEVKLGRTDQQASWHPIRERTRNFR